ncbi:MAG: ferrous iron transporter B [Clostridiales bacterium]|nr:ferrous iron transporter B [Clostridiales bacterium]
MGLTSGAMGAKAIDLGLSIEKKAATDRVVALAGNPNVGKSTLFNRLTGLNQHTGNWPGKTVTNARGSCLYHDIEYILVDIPGTYSLTAASAEEAVARNFICFGGADATVIVCDATCLERNLMLVLQTLEVTQNVILCVNLIDEAAKKQIDIDYVQLEKHLGIPVIPTSAAGNRGLDRLMAVLESHRDRHAFSITYPAPVERALALLTPAVAAKTDFNPRWISLKLLDGDKSLLDALENHVGIDLRENPALSEATKLLRDAGLSPTLYKDRVTASLVEKAEAICASCVFFNKPDYNAMDRRLDKILLSRATGIPVMLLLLSLVFWLTVSFSNVPSQALSAVFFSVEAWLLALFQSLNAPDWLTGALIHGVYRIATTVVAVMLPPMAIFFPLFTLLEDFGYLPRVAFNLDHSFKKCRSCGKQALTMCMGFGCNAAGVVGCRIIDSPRERLIAVITNNFVPCNGRFPPPQ